MPFHGLELFALLIVVLLIFGPKRLPELGGAIGKTFQAFKKGTGEEEPQPPSQKITIVSDKPDQQ
jgi:sec-independent protein translocase protein TatA